MTSNQTAVNPPDPSTGGAMSPIDATARNLEIPDDTKFVKGRGVAFG